MIMLVGTWSSISCVHGAGDFQRSTKELACSGGGFDFCCWRMLGGFFVFKAFRASVAVKALQCIDSLDAD